MATELVLRISQDAESGWWKIAGPDESGLYIANPSLERCVADILPSWRGMAKLSPSQVPPVPPASPAAAAGVPTQEQIDAARVAAGIELEDSFEAGSKWCVGDDELRSFARALFASPVAPAGAPTEEENGGPEQFRRQEPYRALVTQWLRDTLGGVEADNVGKTYFMALVSLCDRAALLSAGAPAQEPTLSDERKWPEGAVFTDMEGGYYDENARPLSHPAAPRNDEDSSSAVSGAAISDEGKQANRSELPQRLGLNAAQEAGCFDLNERAAPSADAPGEKTC